MLVGMQDVAVKPAPIRRSAEPSATSRGSCNNRFGVGTRLATQGGMTAILTPVRLLRGGAVLLLLSLVGCSNVSRSLERSTPREEVTASVDAAAAQVAEVNGRIDAALRALDDLANHPATDLRRQHRTYVEAVDKLEASMNDLRDESESMERKSREYLVAWDREIATMQDDGLRNRTTERRRDVAERIDALHDRYVNARKQLAPLLQRLRETQSAIRMDLTSAGIDTIRPTVNSATDAASPAREALRELAEAFRRAANALAPITQSPPR
jgi:chromosome segregation ATPase